MQIGIIAAMAEEAHILIESLQDRTVIELHEFEFYQGLLHGHSVIVLQAGVGKVNAAIGATVMLTCFKIDYLINTGSAGGIGAQLRIGDVVVAQRLAYHDVDVTAFNYAYGQMAGMPLYYEADSYLCEIAQSALADLDLPTYQGIIVSGDSFVHGAELLDNIRQYFPEALACEMESTAIGQVAYVLRVPFVVIRAISDGGDEQAQMNFDEFIVMAGKQSAQVVMQMLKKLSKNIE